MASHNQVEDLRLPATVIGRIVKEALPANAAVSKEARTAIARAASVFILNMTTYANDYATSKKRKTVTAEDVYQAVKIIECDQIEKPLKEAVEIWKVLKTQKNEEAKKRKAERAADTDKSTIVEESGDVDMEEADTPPPVLTAEEDRSSTVSPKKTPGDAAPALVDIEDAY